MVLTNVFICRMRVCVYACNVRAGVRAGVRTRVRERLFDVSE